MRWVTGNGRQETGDVVRVSKGDFPVGPSLAATPDNKSIVKKFQH